MAGLLTMIHEREAPFESDRLLDWRNNKLNLRGPQVTDPSFSVSRISLSSSSFVFSVVDLALTHPAAATGAPTLEGAAVPWLRSIGSHDDGGSDARLPRGGPTRGWGWRENGRGEVVGMRKSRPLTPMPPAAAASTPRSKSTSGHRLRAPAGSDPLEGVAGGPPLPEATGEREGERKREELDERKELGGERERDGGKG
jgi:hypothetical protein